MALVVAFTLILFWVVVRMCAACHTLGGHADINSGKPGGAAAEAVSGDLAFWCGFRRVLAVRTSCGVGEMPGVHVLYGVRYPRLCGGQAHVFVVLGVCPSTCVVPSRSVSSVLDIFTPVFELYVRLRERRQRAATCVVLVDLHSSLACAYGATVGPFVRDCETESRGSGVPVRLEVEVFLEVAMALVVAFTLPLFWVFVRMCTACRTLGGHANAGRTELGQALLSQEGLLRRLSRAIRSSGAVFSMFLPRGCRAEWGKRREFVFFAEVWCWLISTLLWLVLMERQLDLSSVTVRLRGSSRVVLSGLDTGVMNQ
ncbi:hypothetical protein Taro_041984 [Colocasia esculenta]|uniref:Uncharacterized protein n=1 Tax=Colocasia esculenta TaxID=4460 RepID=A0A843WRG3_COLES|nr:hypothetical protein [Colocasia esculenta]